MIKIVTLDDALDEFDVLEPGLLDSEICEFQDWFAVTNSDGIIAVFAYQDDALRFRLNEVNRMLNG